jgi:phage repressor protein C with HTH and peptisase S24 domain
MTPKFKAGTLPDWAAHIIKLRERLKINQAELARWMDCSPMTISRWERGLLQPSAQHFIQLGNLGDSSEAWFFWEMAGIQPSKMIESLNGSSRIRKLKTAPLDMAHAGAKATDAGEVPEIIGIPLLNARVGSHGVQGDRRSSLHTIPASQAIGAPGRWCPNPGYTNLLRVKGHSMEPLIRDGDIIAVDSSQTDRNDLYGKIVIAVHEQKGMCVSHLRRYESIDVLEGENRQHEPVVLNKASGWRILGRVLWWISAAP